MNTNMSMNMNNVKNRGYRGGGGEEEEVKKKGGHEGRTQQDTNKGPTVRARNQSNWPT